MQWSIYSEELIHAVAYYKFVMFRLQGSRFVYILNAKAAVKQKLSSTLLYNSPAVQAFDRLLYYIALSGDGDLSLSTSDHSCAWRVLTLTT